MKSSVYLLFGSFFSLALLAQEDRPIETTPEMSLTFPLVQTGKQVHVPYPVLMNPTTILTPQAILRVIYQMPQVNGQANDLGLVHHATMEQAYSRDTSGNKEQSNLPPEIIHMVEGMRRISWDTPLNFRLCFAQYPLTYIHLIYALPKPDRSQEMVDQIFSLFDGLLVGLPGSEVTVITVENKSKADLAGIKAGDQILSIGGQPVHGDLNAFANAYAQAKDAAQFNRQANYAMLVRAPGGPPREIKIAMPPNLNTDLFMQGVSR